MKLQTCERFGRKLNEKFRQLYKYSIKTNEEFLNRRVPNGDSWVMRESWYSRAPPAASAMARKNSENKHVEKI